MSQFGVVCYNIVCPFCYCCRIWYDYYKVYWCYCSNYL